jgi:hypothetical protein
MSIQIVFKNGGKMKLSMAEGNLEARVERILAEAIELADIGGIKVPVRSIADRVYDSEPDLMAELQRPWMVERLIWMISRKRRSTRRNSVETEAQLPLPGFEDLPRTIFLPNGRRHRLDHANRTHIIEHIKMLKSRLSFHPKIEKMEAVLALMTKYSDTEPGITWGEVKRKEIANRA